MVKKKHMDQVPAIDMWEKVFQSMMHNNRSADPQSETDDKFSERATNPVTFVKELRDLAITENDAERGERIVKWMEGFCTDDLIYSYPSPRGWDNAWRRLLDNGVASVFPITEIMYAQKVQALICKIVLE